MPRISKFHIAALALGGIMLPFGASPQDSGARNQPAQDRPVAADRTVTVPFKLLPSVYLSVEAKRALANAKPEEGDGIGELIAIVGWSGRG